VSRLNVTSAAARITW